MSRHGSVERERQKESEEEKKGKKWGHTDTDTENSSISILFLRGARLCLCLCLCLYLSGLFFFFFSFLLTRLSLFRRVFGIPPQVSATVLPTIVISRYILIVSFIRSTSYMSSIPWFPLTSLQYPSRMRYNISCPFHEVDLYPHVLVASHSPVFFNFTVTRCNLFFFFVIFTTLDLLHRQSHLSVLLCVTGDYM